MKTFKQIRSEATRMPVEAPFILDEGFFKVTIPDMSPTFIEASAVSAVKNDLRRKLKPEVFKELSIERVTVGEMKKMYRDMAQGKEVEEEVGDSWNEKRDYKAEYKKFQSSPEKIKYRAELVKYNRDKGTYGNGDGKDASHKKGKISGFEKESKNRGRAEKSRLEGSKRTK